mgnify:CR=1 FL=1
MPAPQRLEQQKKIQEVASLLIPLQGHTILLPNVTVAEIVPVSEVQPIQEAPAWYLGNCIWRELTVPVLSIEALNGDVTPSVHSKARFAVLNTTGINENLPFIAVDSDRARYDSIPVNVNGYERPWLKKPKM